MDPDKVVNEADYSFKATKTVQNCEIYDTEIIDVDESKPGE